MEEQTGLAGTWQQMRRTVALGPLDREGVGTEGAPEVQPKAAAAAAAAAANMEGTKSVVHSMVEDSGRGGARCNEQPAPEVESKDQ